MLSTQNPPNDPSCSCNFSHVIGSSNELDQSLDHQHHHSNFSIRDYVCSIRCKDIKNNWPFSPKSLQLCLRHGVKDPLPPFQALDAVRNRSFWSNSRLLETRSSHEKQTKYNVERKPENVASNQKLVESRKVLDDSNLCPSRAENDLPSNTSVSQSEIESVPFNRSPSKKSGFMLKLRSTEDISSSGLAVSELMASKTCPVCKTFSSASNTTLNAHIDQCLSVTSTPAGSRPIKHRIKPRKIRLMTDVYTTASERTLEELDRRNGTSWATLSSLPVQDNDKFKVSDEVKKQRISPGHPDEDNSGIGPVYIDASGKKLRSLSEFNDNTSRMLRKGRDVGAKKKSLEVGKGRSKFFSTEKKSRHGKKHRKYLRLFPQSRKLCSYKANASQISQGQEGYSGEGSCEEQQIWKQLKRSQPGTLRHGILANCTGFAKKMNKQRYAWYVSQDPPVQSCIGDSRVSRNQVQKCVNFPGSTVSFHVNKFRSSKVAEKDDLSSLRERARSPFLRARVTEKQVRHVPLIQQNTNQMRKNFASIHKSLIPRPPHSTRRIFCNEAANYSDASDANSLKPSMLPSAFTSKTSRFSSMSQNLSATEASSNLVKKLKKSQLHFTEKKNEKLEERESEINQESALMDSDTEDSGEVEERPINSISSISGNDYYDDERDEDANNDDDDAVDKIEDPETSGSRDFSLSKSLDAEFYQSESTHRAGMTFIGMQEMYSADEVGNEILGQTACTTMELDDSDVGQGNSFTGVDPIPIPGPPGSFLPSPRDMGSDDFAGDSSLTTSQVQSSHDQLDFIDRNSSESPISVASTMSNSTAAKSDHEKYSEELSLVRENITSGCFSTSNFERTVNFVSPSQQTSTRAERTSIPKKLSIHRISVDKEPSGFGNYDQTCCCQRKERVVEGVTLNYQEPGVLNRRTVSSVIIPEKGRLVGFNQNIKSGNSATIPSMVSSSSFSNPDLERKFANGVDHESPSPSTSNPVLRLMGKNLMVVNKGEEASILMPHGQAGLSLPSNQFPHPSRISPCNLPKEDIDLLHHTTPQGSPVFGQNPRDGTGLNIDVRNCFGDNTKITMTQQTQSQVPPGTYPNHFGYVPYFSQRLS